MRGSSWDFGVRPPCGRHRIGRSRPLFATLVIGGVFAALSATAFGGAAAEVQRRGTAKPKWQVFTGLRIEIASPVLGA